MLQMVQQHTAKGHAFDNVPHMRRCILRAMGGQNEEDASKAPKKMGNAVYRILILNMAKQVFGYEGLEFDEKDGTTSWALADDMHGIMKRLLGLIPVGIVILFPWMKPLLKSTIAKGRIAARQIYADQEVVIERIAQPFLESYQEGRSDGRSGKSDVAKDSIISRVWDRLGGKNGIMSKGEAIDLLGVVMWAGGGEWKGAYRIQAMALQSTEHLPCLYRLMIPFRHSEWLEGL
jgi:hypothetical protein